ncbi:heat shock 70 kDa protein 12B-like isoform X1 [Lampetra planeri]
MSEPEDAALKNMTLGAEEAEPQTQSHPGSPAGCGIAPLTPSMPAKRGEEQPPARGFSVVVAIDFGTTSSGYAYSFTSEPSAIHMMRRWEGGDPGVSSQKTPTALLLTPDGRFHSLGFSARDFFHDLEPSEATSWLYFDKFKMKLHDMNVISLDTELEATNGKMVKALEVFAHALRFFKERALQELSDQTGLPYNPDEIRWVITVPAIWKQPAKQFMREAAYAAGIATPQAPEGLLIALEPEAASIYCRKLRLNQLTELAASTHVSNGHGDSASPTGFSNGWDVPRRSRHSQKATFVVESSVGELWSELQAGDKYLVADCGGGTVDLTVHQIEHPQGTLKELHKASGGPYGSLAVDQAFERLLGRIFSAEFIVQFRRNRPAAWVDLTIAFESRKRTAAPGRAGPLNISLPFSFVDYYKKVRGHSVETALRKSGVEFVKWSSQGMLRLSAEAMNDLFQPTIQKIVQCIGDVLSRPGVEGVKLLFLVGGFAESRLLQRAVQEAFSPECRVIVPHGVGLAILKGAVLFGLDPTVVRVRRSAVAYGVGVLNRFVESKHPEEKLLVKDGARWCTDVFDRFVSADQSVSLGETVTRSYTPARLAQTKIIINVYCSSNDEARFITDEGVHKCGTLCLDLGAESATTPGQAPPRRRREIRTHMLFGDTEVRVTAVDVRSAKSVKSSVDFLSV